MDEMEFLWASGRFSELPLIELVQAVPGPRAKEAWSELVRREECCGKQSARVAALEGAARDIRDGTGHSLNYRESLNGPISRLLDLVPDQSGEGGA